MDIWYVTDPAGIVRHAEERRGDMENFPLLEIEGTPYEIGYKHGGVFKEKIAGTIQCYREMFKDYSDLEWERASMVMMKIRQKNGKPDIFMVTEAGIIGKTGFNSAGICLYLNALSTNQAPKGLPLHLAMRGILDCGSLAEAIGAATRFPLGCCANFMIGHKNGECADIEIENGDFDVLYPRDGILVHTNHFVSPRLPILPRKDTSKQKFPDTFVRLGRADKLLRKKGRDISEKDIMEVLRDHVEYPSSICRHEDLAAPKGKRMGTVFSMVVNLTQGKIYFCKGNPCEQGYEEYGI